jgi:hypothetical protein
LRRGEEGRREKMKRKEESEMKRKEDEKWNLKWKERERGGGEEGRERRKKEGMRGE